MAKVPAGVVKIESEVFHFQKPENPSGLSDFYKPRAVVLHPTGGPSVTRQEFAQECDVNEIMERFAATGVLPNVGEPFYYDFTSLPPTMQDAMEVMRKAGDAFMTLNAKVRREFDNDAAQWADFASDPDNLDQMRAWGLAPPAPAPEPQPAPPAGVLTPQPSPGPAPSPSPSELPKPS